MEAIGGAMRELKGRAIDKAFAEGQNVITCGREFDKDGNPTFDETYYVDDKPKDYYRIIEWLDAENEQRCIDRENEEWARQWAWEQTLVGKKWKEQQDAERDAEAERGE